MPEPLLICDATTGSGKRCRNTATGSSSGKNYCGIDLLRRQLQESNPEADTGVEVAGEEAPEEPAEALVGLEMPEVAELPPSGGGESEEHQGWAALSALGSCRCGGRLSFWGSPSAEPGTEIVCLQCETKSKLVG